MSNPELMPIAIIVLTIRYRGLLNYVVIAYTIECRLKKGILSWRQRIKDEMI